MGMGWPSRLTKILALLAGKYFRHAAELTGALFGRRMWPLSPDLSTSRAPSTAVVMSVIVAQGVTN